MPRTYDTNAWFFHVRASLDLDEPARLELINQLVEIAVEHLAIDVELAEERRPYVAQRRPRADQLPETCAHLVQPKVGARSEVQEDGFTIEDTREHVG